MTKKHIHTTISKSSYLKLMEYGKGYLGAGIENLIKIVESKNRYNNYNN